METGIYHTIIVGAGPAGSTAAFLLSKAGLRVLIIEKSTFPRQKLCAGLITWKTARLLERLYKESPEALKEKGIINYASHGYEIYGGKTLVSSRNVREPFLFVDRDRYDHFLLKKAVDAGANVLEGETLGSIDILRGSVKTRSGQQLRSEFIIGADGVNSRVRRSFPVELFGRETWSEDLAAAHEVFINRKEVTGQYDRPLLYFGLVENGYAWIFPNRDRLKIGMCARLQGRRKKILSAFRSFLSSRGLDRVKTEYSSSYVLPCGNFLPEPVHRNVLLLGDAAGFADPLVGEGIYYAQRSAELAVQSILVARQASRDSEQQYRKMSDSYLQLLQRFIFPELVYAGKIRNAIFGHFSRCRYLPLKISMALCGDMPAETIHGIRSYQWMKKHTSL